jgi:hypothetical protein
MPGQESRTMSKEWVENVIYFGWLKTFVGSKRKEVDSCMIHGIK